MSRWGVALVGCGTVGGGTAQILTESARELTSRTGSAFPLVAVVDKDHGHARALGIDPTLFRSDLDAVLSDPAVSVVVELVGGTGFAKTVIEKALNAGKSVVTANKALLATHGRELFARARAAGLAIGFEASCAGAIPIVRTLAEDLAANRIDALAGIVNGTCNAILTDMATQGLDYATALKRAQQAGYAEADPFLDVSGTDSAHKLVLLSSVAFGAWVDWHTVPLKGLDAVQPEDLAAAAALGASVKLLARAQRTAQGLQLTVEPTVIPLPHPLATLSGPFNGVLVEASEAGHLYFQGRGAGARPTASAVVADLLGLAAGTLTATQRDYSCWPDVAPVVALAADVAEGPWFIHGQGRPAEVVNGVRRSELERQGFRVFPWFRPE